MTGHGTLVRTDLRGSGTPFPLEAPMSCAMESMRIAWAASRPERDPLPPREEARVYVSPSSGADERSGSTDMECSPHAAIHASTQSASWEHLPSYRFDESRATGGKNPPVVFALSLLHATPPEVHMSTRALIRRLAEVSGPRPSATSWRRPQRVATWAGGA